MFELGCYDADVSKASCDAYQKEVETITRVPLANVVEGSDKLKPRQLQPTAADTLSVRAVQQALKTLGFFPGGKDDGICGYRTQSALRLFQETVRHADKLADFTPDGRFGPQTQKHLQRWLGEGHQPDWSAVVARWKAGDIAGSEYATWLDLLAKVKQRHGVDPSRVLNMVNQFDKPSDTRKVAQWDFSPAGTPQLIGLRRTEFNGKFDDIFILLVKGLVFKFQGSTEPGATKNPAGLPFLVPGQHDYHFGWHQSTYLALRPLRHGVLVVRSKNDKRLDDGDLASGLEPNGSINIHWGGLGIGREVNAWSEGCQVINGTVYINPDDELINCSSFAALNKGDLASSPGKTRGAYNMLVDLVTALASDAPEPSLRYTLLDEQDVALMPSLQPLLARARDRVVKLAG